ncbi:hypothetical protein VP01_674g6 [Puccinia sorghi]|uniref:Uncharacterized protein n=1 Tax=Puccinia sorghi TaxID=27349 RepID=A0A0L6UEN0_9BASI|nr:hypothetical protein VP01_674g6 [Puccinia sorghi]
MPILMFFTLRSQSLKQKMDKSSVSMGGVGGPAEAVEGGALGSQSASSLNMRQTNKMNSQPHKLYASLAPKTRMRHLTNNPAEVYSLVFALGLDGCLIETLKKTGNLYQCTNNICLSGEPMFAAQNEENDFSSHQALVNWQDTLYAKTQGN